MNGGIKTKYQKIPKERVAILIGHNGKTKETIERRSKAKLEIDSESGDVVIELSDSDDPLMSMKLGNVVKAIARGFSPEHAFVLFGDDYYFQLIDIREFAGKSPKSVHRTKGRIIGKGGKTRRILEETSETYVSIYGNTIGLIGQDMNLQVATTAVEMLLNGARHSSVYSFLEKKRSEIKMYRYGFD